MFPSVFLQLQMLSHPVFPRSKKFQNIHKTKIFPWSRLQVAKAGANMREKMRQNVLTMLRPLEKVNQQSGRWSYNIIIGRRQRIRMRRSTRPTRNLNKRTSMWSFPSWPGRCRRTGRRAKRRWWTSLCLPSTERRRRRMPPSALRRGSGESGYAWFQIQTKRTQSKRDLSVSEKKTRSCGQSSKPSWPTLSRSRSSRRRRRRRTRPTRSTTIPKLWDRRSAQPPLKLFLARQELRTPL